MKIIKPWIERFQISEAMLHQWLREAPAHADFTFWCLTNKKIEPEHYLLWAQEFFEIARVKAAYFANPNFELWAKISPVANWSASMIPIVEWDGTVFVACVEPENDIKWSFPVRYVLAHPDDLAQYWESLQRQTGTPLQTSPSISSSPQTFTSIPVPPQTLPSIPNSTSPSIPHADYDAPEGLNLNLTMTKVAIVANDDYMDQLAKKIKNQKTSVNLNAPDNLTWQPKQQITDSDLAPEGLFVISDPNMSATLLAELPPIPEATQFKHNTAPVQMPVAQTSAQNSSHVIDAKIFLQLVKSEFTGGMLLEVKNDHFIPNIWDDNFKSTNPKAMSQWSLTGVSAFRVAIRTKLPYLGHAVDTAINTEFFQSWGFSSLPPAILIQPIIIGDRVRFLLMTLVAPGQKNHITLTAGEKLLSAIARHIDGNRAA